MCIYVRVYVLSYSLCFGIFWKPINIYSSLGLAGLAWLSCQLSRLIWFNESSRPFLGDDRASWLLNFHTISPPSAARVRTSIPTILLACLHGLLGWLCSFCWNIVLRISPGMKSKREKSSLQICEISINRVDISNSVNRVMDSLLYSSLDQLKKCIRTVCVWLHVLVAFWGVFRCSRQTDESPYNMCFIGLIRKMVCSKGKQLGLSSIAIYLSIYTHSTG